MYIETPIMPALTPNVKSQFIIWLQIVFGAIKYPVNAIPPSRGIMIALVNAKAPYINLPVLSVSGHLGFYYEDFSFQ